MTPAALRIAARGLELACVDWGNGAAPTLLLVHGNRDHARSWDRVAAALCDDWHVVVPDLRGHGDSDWSADAAYASPFLVDDMACVVDALGTGKVTIVAHSMGAVIALRYAALFPERVARIAAIEGIGLSHPMMQRPVAERWRSFLDDRRAIAARPRRAYPTIADAMARMRAQNPRLDEDLLRHLTVHATRQVPEGFVWKFDPMIRARYPYDISDDEQRALWGAIDCPVWLVHGAESWARHPDEGGRAAAFRHATVTSYSGAAHWPQHDCPDAFVAGLRRFLAG